MTIISGAVAVLLVIVIGVSMLIQEDELRRKLYREENLRISLGGFFVCDTPIFLLAC